MRTWKSTAKGGGGSRPGGSNAGNQPQRGGVAGAKGGESEAEEARSGGVEGHRPRTGSTEPLAEQQKGLFLFNLICYKTKKKQKGSMPTKHGEGNNEAGGGTGPDAVLFSGYRSGRSGWWWITLVSSEPPNTEGKDTNVKKPNCIRQTLDQNIQLIYTIIYGSDFFPLKRATSEYFRETLSEIFFPHLLV